MLSWRCAAARSPCATAEPYAGFSLRAPAPIDAQRYSGIVFWVHGGESGERRLRFYIQQGDSGGESRVAQFEVPAGTWTPITIALSSLGNLQTIKRLNLQDNSGQRQPTFYVDNVRLVSGTLDGALSIPFTGPTEEGGYVVYSDALADGWENWSWESQVDFANREPVFAGQRSIAVQMPNGNGGLSLRAPITLDGEAYSAIRLRLRGAKPEPRQITSTAPTRATTRGQASSSSWPAASGSRCACRWPSLAT